MSDFTIPAADISAGPAIDIDSNVTQPVLPHSDVSSLLHHALYACAQSHGIDENGRPESDDLADQNPQQNGQINLYQPVEWEMKDEMKRQRQAERVKAVLEVIMQEIDRWGIMRKPDWDSVRALVLLVPLLDRRFFSNCPTL